MRAQILNGLLLLVAVSGAWLWIGLDHGAHAATSGAFLFAILSHMKRADRSVQRKGGLMAAAAVLVVAGLGLMNGEAAALAHVAAALVLVGAAVMMHVRALGTLMDVLDAAALALVVWLGLRIAGLF